MKKILIIILAIIILAVGAVGAFAANYKIAPLPWTLWGDVNQESGVGASGYDVVSYHLAEQPTKGNQTYRSNWNGTSWYFSNAENKVLFDSNPERYAPAYGGFCAYAVYNNLAADVDPLAWYIHDDRLNLFVSEDRRDNWIADIPQGAVEKSNQNWAQR